MPPKTCYKGHTFTKTSNCPTCPVCAKEELKTAYAGGFPKIGSPAFIALKQSGIMLSDLPKYSEKELLSIHGVGPSAVSRLREYLEAKGLEFVKK